MFDLIGELMPFLLRGLRVTVQLTIASAILGFFMAFLAGIARMSKRVWIRSIAAVYVEIFRGTSALVQLFWLFFVLPFFGIHLSPYIAGVLALGLNVGAYGSEVVRGAIQSISKTQIEASVALNLTWLQRMRYVILPQALLRMLPAFGNQIVELIKMTALVSLVTLQDVTYYGKLLSKTKGNMITVYAVVLLLYFALAYPCTYFVGWMERKARWVGYGEAR